MASWEPEYRAERRRQRELQRVYERNAWLVLSALVSIYLIATIVERSL